MGESALDVSTARRSILDSASDVYEDLARPAFSQELCDDDHRDVG